MDLIDRDEFLEDLEDYQFFTEEDKRMFKLFICLLKSRESYPSESYWTPILCHTPAGDYKVYKCPVCDSIVGEVNEIRPHCPNCGTKMKNFSNLTR